MRAKTNNQVNTSVRFGGYTIEQFLGMLDSVSKQGDGYIARCPAHDDGRPSLRVREGHRGIMVQCWAGCTFHEIVNAMNINPSMMFYDALDDQQLRERKIAGIESRLLELEVRIMFGQNKMDSGDISDSDRVLLQNYIGEKIELQRELHETEKM